MLKKLGIVAATATAGLLALSPLAFATDKGHHGHHGSPDEVTNVWIEDDSVERNQSTECDFEQEVDADALVGPLVVTQTQSNNCNNAGDDADFSVTEILPILP